MIIVSAIPDRQMYGNDEESILKIIKSLDTYKNATIDIVGIQDINDNRIVGFLSNDKPSYLQLLKNKDGNYKWTYVESKNNGENIAFFITSIDKNETHNPISHLMLMGIFLNKN
jgi:hypothetical protein